MTLMDEIHAWLTAPDGMARWKRHVHARCNGTTIRCPWCDEMADKKPKAMSGDNVGGP